MPKIYKVGGVVRDALLGIENKDVDFTFVLDEQERIVPGLCSELTVTEGFNVMYEWMKERKYSIFLSTPEMFTIRAKFPHGHIYDGLVADFVLARKELGYIPDTRTPILALGTLADDLERRDFTVNAMAEDEDGKIIDLFNGKLALSNRILITPIDPKITMMDDPLRILRAMRFSITKNFDIHVDIWEAMKQPAILEKLGKTVSNERIREEVKKMMKHDTVKTLKLLNLVESTYIPGFLDLIFRDGTWLEPTNKK